MVSGCFLMGLWYREQFMGRLKTLRTLAEIQEMLMSQIRFGKATLPECCKVIGRRLGEPFGESLLGVYMDMEENTGMEFSRVFCRRMEECLGGLPITEEDKNLFLSFAVSESFEEGRMQLRAIEQGREQLQNRIDALEKENGEKCRMAVGLGAMSGLLLLIVLL